MAPSDGNYIDSYGHLLVNSGFIFTYLVEIIWTHNFQILGLVVWLARSPDLNLLDYFLWGYVKEFIYKNPIETLEELEEQFHCATGSITSEMLQLTQ